MRYKSFFEHMSEIVPVAFVVACSVYACPDMVLGAVVMFLLVQNSLVQWPN